MTTRAFAAQSAASRLGPFTITRRDPLPRDVEMDILYCGVCHTDLHFARNDWGFTTYPVVPGHEILGRVERIGNEVTRFKVGDLAGVGCLVDSCRTCSSCKDGLEQFCLAGTVLTYNGPDKHSGGVTYDVACEIEMIRVQQINEAYERMLRSDVKYRFVIDMASLKS